MSINGVHVTGIEKNKVSSFIVIKKNALGQNIPNKDVILAPDQKIRINDKDKKVESLVNNKTILKKMYNDSYAYSLMSNKVDYLCIHNLFVVCGNKSENENINNENTNMEY